MRTHQDLDRRSLALTQAIVAKIDAEPTRGGLEKAKQVNARWMAKGVDSAIREWNRLLDLPWKELREVLLDPSEEGKRLRQTAPFCGILSPRERWDIYRRFRDEAC